jgi:hypothetical protein
MVPLLIEGSWVNLFHIRLVLADTNFLSNSQIPHQNVLFFLLAEALKLSLGLHENAFSIFAKFTNKYSTKLKKHRF